MRLIGIAILGSLAAHADTSVSKTAQARPLLAAWQAERSTQDSLKAPSFLLRDDGQVIFTRKVGGTFHYYSVQLTPNEVASWTASLPQRPAFDKLRAEYTPSPRSRELGLESMIAWFHDDAAHCVSVFGMLEPDCETRQSDAAARAQACVRPRTPPIYLRLWDRIAAFDSPRAAPWQPERLQVNLVRAYDDYEKTVLWPEGVPHQFAGDDKMQQQLLDGKYLPAIRRLEAEMGIMGQVRLAEKNWRIVLWIESPLPAPTTFCSSSPR